MKKKEWKTRLLRKMRTRKRDEMKNLVRKNKIFLKK